MTSGMLAATTYTGATGEHVRCSAELDHGCGVCRRSDIRKYIYKWTISQLFQQPPYNYDVFIKSRDRAWRKQGHRCIAAGRLGTSGKLLTTGGRNWLTAGGGKRLTAEGIKCDNK